MHIQAVLLGKFLQTHFHRQVQSLVTTMTNVPYVGSTGTGNNLSQYKTLPYVGSTGGSINLSQYMTPRYVGSTGFGSDLSQDITLRHAGSTDGSNNLVQGITTQTKNCSFMRALKNTTTEVNYLNRWQDGDTFGSCSTELRRLQYNDECQSDSIIWRGQSILIQLCVLQ